MTLLGRSTTVRIAPDVSTVEYEMRGLWSDRIERQRIRISRERFETHQRPDQVCVPIIRLR